MKINLTLGGKTIMKLESDLLMEGNYLARIEEVTTKKIANKSLDAIAIVYLVKVNDTLEKTEELIMLNEYATRKLNQIMHSFCTVYDISYEQFDLKMLEGTDVIITIAHNRSSTGLYQNVTYHEFDVLKEIC